MLTVRKLRQEAKRLKIEITKGTNHYFLALAVAQTRATELPSCFGILFNKDAKKCKRCKVKAYCEVAVARGLFADAYLAGDYEEDFRDNSTRTGFKEGSRPALLIQRWGRKKSTRQGLIELSKDMFKSEIDIDGILKQLKEKKLLVIDGEYYGVKR